MLAFLDPASLVVSWKLISLDEKGLRGKGKIRLFGGEKGILVGKDAVDPSLQTRTERYYH